MAVRFRLSPRLSIMQLMQKRVMEARWAHNPKEFVRIGFLQNGYVFMTYLNILEMNAFYLTIRVLWLFTICIWGIILINRNLLIFMSNIELTFFGICLLLLIISIIDLFFHAQIFTLIILSIIATEFVDIYFRLFYGTSIRENYIFVCWPAEVKKKDSKYSTSFLDPRAYHLKLRKIIVYGLQEYRVFFYCGFWQ